MATKKFHNRTQNLVDQSQNQEKESQSVCGLFMTRTLTDSSNNEHVCPSPMPHSDGTLMIHPVPLITDHPSTEIERRFDRMEQFVSIGSLMKRIHEIYRSNLTSPKWKNFQGTEIGNKDKIRLNNAIWRIWHQQYCEHRKTTFCQFVSPLTTKNLQTRLSCTLQKQFDHYFTYQYIKWRQCIKKNLLKTKKKENQIENRKIENENFLSTEINVPQSDFLSFLDDFDFIHDQLLFTSRAAPIFLDQNQIGFSANPDFYQPKMGNFQLDFSSLEDSIFHDFPNEDFSTRFNVETFPPFLNQNDFPINNSQTENLGTLPIENFSEIRPATPQIAPSRKRSRKSTGSTLVDLLHQKQLLNVFNNGEPSRKIFKPNSISNETLIVPKKINGQGSARKRKNPRKFPAKLNGPPPEIEPTKSSSPSSSSSTGLNAENKRRQNIKNGFETLRSLIPEMNDSSNVKMSNAQMLDFTARHIEKIVEIRNKMKIEVERLQREKILIEEKIRETQKSLPSEGFPSISAEQRSRQVLNNFFRRYIHERTRKKWFFFPFWLILQPSFEHFRNVVTSNSPEEFLRQLEQWKSESMSLGQFRGSALEVVMKIGQKTSSIAAPSTLPREMARLESEFQC